MQAILGSLFSSIIFLGFINFQMIIPTFLTERPVMTRERASRMYSVLPWVQAMEDVEIPWIVVQVCLSCSGLRRAHKFACLHLQPEHLKS